MSEMASHAVTAKYESPSPPPPSPQFIENDKKQREKDMGSGMEYKIFSVPLLSVVGV